MISRYTQGALTWIDLEEPTIDEISTLAEEFDLHPIVASELAGPSERGKVDVYSNAVYMILHFPVKNRASGAIEEIEVDFVLFKDVLITTHYVLVDRIHDFARMFEAGNYFGKSEGKEHAGYIFYLAVRELYRHTLFLLEGAGHNLREIEKHIFSGKESAMVERISHANRTFIDIRQSLRHHKDTLESFSRASNKLYGDEFSYYTNSIEGYFGRIERMLGENREIVRDLKDTNDSLLSTKTNDAIKRLTAVNIVLLPLGLISWIFAMESKYLSLDDPRALITVFAIMGAIALFSIIYFRSKKWL